MVWGSGVNLVGPQGSQGPIGPAGTADAVDLKFLSAPGTRYLAATDWLMLRPSKQMSLSLAGALVHVSISAEYDGGTLPTDLSLCYGNNAVGEGKPMQIGIAPLQFRAIFPARDSETPGVSAMTFSLSGTVVPDSAGLYWVGPCYKTVKGLYLYYGSGFIIPL